MYLTQYSNSEVCFEIEEKTIHLLQRQDPLNGSMMISSENNAKQTVNEIASAYANKPDFRKYDFTVNIQEDTEFSLCLRIPDWISKEASLYVNDELI